MTVINNTHIVWGFCYDPGILSHFSTLDIFSIVARLAANSLIIKGFSLEIIVPGCERAYF